MPGFPSATPSALNVAGSVFSGLADRIAGVRGERYPLHVGDTWMPAPVVLSALSVPDDAHRYSPPQGLPALINALADGISARQGLLVERSSLTVTAGATEGLAIVAGAMLSPGDEVLVLAPHWPLIAGIITYNRGVAVAVDTLGLSDADLLVALTEAVSERTVAIYVNTPNNPTGRVLGRAALEGIAELARRRGLWLLADEVYEHHQFVGEHVALRSVAPERTVSVHSCSKALGLAGYRVGAVVSPTPLAAAVANVRAHSSYNTATVSQHVALAALRDGAAEWIADSRRVYEAAGHRAADTLAMPRVAGGTFLFVDVSSALDERGLLGWLERAADRGLFVAPGPSFGPYPHHVRLCFTCAPPDITQRGVEVLRELL